jgi:hypothetical protein
MSKKNEEMRTLIENKRIIVIQDVATQSHRF